MLPPSPPIKGHPVVHTTTVPRAPPETNHAGIIKRMREAIFETLVKDRGVLGLDKVIKALKHKSVPSPFSWIK